MAVADSRIIDGRYHTVRFHMANLTVYILKFSISITTAIRSPLGDCEQWAFS